MPSSKFVQHAKKVIEQHPEVFEALLEYERTGKVPKPNPKRRANFTINAKLLRSYREYCQKQGYTMSARIQKFIQEELRKVS